MTDYLERIRQAFPSLPLDSVRINSDGLVNDVVIVNNARVFRFPKTEDGKAAMAREARALDLIRRYVELPIPAYHHLEADFAAYDLIPGEPLFRNDFLRQDRAAQNRITAQLGGFLRQLHSIPLAEAEAVFGVYDGGATHDDWLRFYESVERELFPLMMSPTRAWVKAHFAPLLSDPHFLARTPSVIHDDLAQYHILVDPAAWTLTGIIDFGTARLGDPAADYGMIINVYGESFLARLAEHAPLIADTIDRARFYAGALELQWLRGGVRANDFSWLTAHIDRARDVQPVGAPLNQKSEP